MPEEQEPEGAPDQLHEVKSAVLRRLLGPSDDHVLHAVMPVWAGGQSSIHVFKQHVKGLAYVTCDLIGPAGQKKNKEWDNYELMICARSEEKVAPGLISGLGRYTLEAVLNPGETMDIGPAAPKGSGISAFFFTKPDVPLPFEVQGIKAGILLRVGITGAELKWRWKKGPEALTRVLREKNVFPFTDWHRDSIL